MKETFKEGVIVNIILILVLAGLIWYFQKQVNEGQIPQLRTFSAIEAFDEGIAKAVEQNKSVFFSPILINFYTIVFDII